MRLELDAPVLDLQQGQVVSLQDAAGTRIVVRTGTVWVTEEGCATDFVLGPGEALTVEHPGRTLVQAIKSGWVSLVEGRSANEPYLPAEEAFLDEVRGRIQSRYY